MVVTVTPGMQLSVSNSLYQECAAYMLMHREVRWGGPAVNAGSRQ